MLHVQVREKFHRISPGQCQDPMAMPEQAKCSQVGWRQQDSAGASPTLPCLALPCPADAK